MKTINIKVGLPFVMMVLILASCSQDFLNRPPQASLVDASFYQNDDQILSGTAALYSMAWKDYCDQANWKVGDAKAGVIGAPGNGYADYADFTNFQITGLSASNLSAYKSFYEVIGQANTVIDNINAYAGSAVTQAIKNHAIAECRFMRATALTYLVMNYGAVPIIDDNLKYLSNPLLKRNTVESIWEFIKRDYRFATKNLLTESAKGQVGRLTKWSAEAMMARTFLNAAGISGTLDQSSLDSAKYFADRVIRLSDRELLKNYADLFLYPYDNNKESLFELEWVFTPSNNYQFNNTMISQISPDNSLAANSDGWGGAWGATSWTLSLYDGLYYKYKIDSTGNHYDSTKAPGHTLDKRLHETFMLPGFKYPELAINGTSTFISAADGVLYNTTLKHGQDAKIANIKKYIIGNIPGATLGQNYPNDVYMLRLAEMYLIYAEAAVIGNTAATDDKALTYFNAIHTRAGLTAAPIDSLTSTTTAGGNNDANKPWKYVFKERIKEFAMEGMAWYDMVRRHYYDPQSVYDIINNQDRGQYLASPSPWPNPTGWSFYKVAWFVPPANIDHAVATDVNFYMPIPQIEKSQAPSLNDDPVPYVFN